MSNKSKTALYLDNVDSRYELVSSSVSALLLQRELDNIARERLPDLLANAVLSGSDKSYDVYRIRDINIDLSICRDSLKSGRLPHLWAQHILRHVNHEINYGLVA